jgi:hypothetical protein
LIKGGIDHWNDIAQLLKGGIDRWMILFNW